MGNHLMIQPMQNSFEHISQYLQVHFGKEIGHRGLAVYGALLILCQRGTLNPTYEETAELALCSESVLRRALDDLDRFGIVTKSRRVDDRGLTLANLYTLNDPDDWQLKATDRLVDSVNQLLLGEATDRLVDSENQLSDDAVTERLVDSENQLSEASTRVSESEEAGLVDSTDSRASNKNNITTTTTTSFYSFNSGSRGSREQEVDPNTPTLASGSGSTKRVPPARVSEPAPPPREPSRSDGDFVKAVRFWQRNCGQVGDAVENVLWGFYIKFGAKLLLESLTTAVTENKFGNKPSMRFVEVILTRRQSEEVNDVARAATLRASVPPPGYKRPDDIVDMIRNTLLEKDEAKRQATIALGSAPMADTEGKPGVTNGQ